MTVAEEIQALGRKARAAARALRTLTTAEKNAALLAVAEAIEAAKPEIDAANAEDVAAAQANGAEPSDEMRHVYDTVFEAPKAALNTARGGLLGMTVDKAARDVIDGAGYKGCFGHATGHSLGLEIHESPNFSPKEERVVPCGAVVSVEPGIYIPEKCGVRIEDIVFLTKNV